MGFDARTGTVVFDDGTTLTRRMPRSEVAVERRGSGAIDGTEFLWFPEFEDGELHHVTLLDARLKALDPQGARELHEAWLEARLGEGRPWLPSAHFPYGGIEYRYRWGTIGSYAYPQDMNAYIEIHYKRRWF